MKKTKKCLRKHRLEDNGINHSCDLPEITHKKPNKVPPHSSFYTAVYISIHNDA